jgi:hypothetical protein
VPALPAPDIIDRRHRSARLPMRVWFRAMHLLAQGKKGLSNIELGGG